MPKHMNIQNSPPPGDVLHHHTALAMTVVGNEDLEDVDANLSHDEDDKGRRYRLPLDSTLFPYFFPFLPYIHYPIYILCPSSLNSAMWVMYSMMITIQQHLTTCCMLFILYSYHTLPFLCSFTFS